MFKVSISGVPDVGGGGPLGQLLRDGRVQHSCEVHDGGLALREVHRVVVAGVLGKFFRVLIRKLNTKTF